MIAQVPGVTKDEGREEEGEKKQGDLPESKAQSHGFFLGRGGCWWVMVIGDWYHSDGDGVDLWQGYIHADARESRRLRTESTNMSLKHHTSPSYQV